MFHSKIDVPETYRRIDAPGIHRPIGIPESWDPRAKKIFRILDDCIEERKAARAAAAPLSPAAVSPRPFVPFWRWKLEQSWRTYAKVAALVLGTAGLIGAGYLENTRRIEAAAYATAKLQGG